MPGIANGSALVFISAIGYYVTLVLVEGPSDQLISYLIAFHTTNTLNWGMASALSLLALLSVAAAFALIRRVLGPMEWAVQVCT